MRYLVVALMLVSQVAWAECNHDFEQFGKAYKCKLCGNWWGQESVRNYDDHKQLLKMGDTIDKIYSMVCDLETKFMGNDRMEQITNPDHIPETVRQILHERNMIKEITGGIPQ